MRKVVIITGTSSGFGKLTAITLAKRGFSVIATMRNSATKNSSAAEELRSIKNIEVIEMDVANDDSVNTAVSQVIAKYRQIDIVINNAAVWGAGVMEAYSVEQQKKMFEVNYFGTVRVYDAVLPIMRQQVSGLIINVTTGASGFTNPYLIPYSASKMAVESLTEGIQEELRPFKIDSVSIQPGVFDTGIINKEGVSADRLAIIQAYGEKAALPMQKMYTALVNSVTKFDMNPQIIADGILKVIQMEPGQRPLRYPIDPIADGTDQEFIDTRAAVKKKWMSRYGFDY